MPAAAIAIALIVTTALAGAAGASPSPDCVPLCRVTCLKPITVADRWDDETPVSGYPEWQRNGFYDQEDFSDSNGNGAYDPGESFADSNSNGVFDSEFYEPLLTGYLASQDLGLLAELKASGPGTASPNVYFPLELPLQPGDYGEELYLWNWSHCHPNVYGVGDILWAERGNMTGPTQTVLKSIQDLDPGASWDPSCRCVVNSAFEASPRLFVIAARDPRFYLSPGKKLVHVTKLLGFFLESVSFGTFRVRLAGVRNAEGEVCGPGLPDGGFVTGCDPVQVQATTWGRIKAIHR